MLTTACLLATLSAAAADSPLLSGPLAGPGPPSLETSHAALRQLQQQSQRTGTTVVSNPLELLSAITAGAAHLEIREHMDLTDLVPFDATASDSAGSDEEGRPAAEAPTPGTEAGGVFSALNYLLGTVPPTLKSIQVRFLLRVHLLLPALTHACGHRVLAHALRQHIICPLYHHNSAPHAILVPRR